MGRRTEKLTDLVVDRYVNLKHYYRKLQKTENGCWEWTGVKNNVGYGFIGFRHIDPETGAPQSGRGGMMTTHRLAWMLANHRLPTLRNINHTCHNKLCCRPDHLVEGTQEDKLRAMIRDGIKGGRPAGAAGNYDHKQEGRLYKYSEAEIQWIRSASNKDIAQRYNLPITRANSLRYEFRRGYRWLPCPPYVKDKRGRKPKND